MSIVRVPLTQGKTAIIDADDWSIVAPYKWRAVRGHRDTWYAKAHIKTDDGRQTTIFMHRLIDGTPKGMQVDHRDHDGLNNQRANLRRCTHQGNLQNMRRKRSNTSGFIGVQWDKQRRRWVADIQHDGSHKFIGSFATAEEAARARDDVAKTIRGEFASLNFPEDSS